MRAVDDFRRRLLRFDAGTEAILAAAKVCEFLYYILGQQHCGARYRAHIDRIASRHAEDPDVLAMQSFAHELCGDFASARALAEKSLRIEARNPWAEHTLSHVAISLGDVDAGERRADARSFLASAAVPGRKPTPLSARFLSLL